MIPLRVTAHLCTPIAVHDDFSPNLENLLIWLLLDSVGKTSPNPTPAEVQANRPFVLENLPLQQGELGYEWYWQASAPHYCYEWETQTMLRGRWDKQEQHLDWKGKRRTWSGSEGHTKAWNIVLYERMAPQIDWWCVGDAERIRALLANCHNLTKKKRAQVVRWLVRPADADYHLWGPQGQLMKPIPIACLSSQVPIDFRIQRWAWRDPAHEISNVADCAMPWQNAIKLAGEGVA